MRSQFSRIFVLDSRKLILRNFLNMTNSRKLGPKNNFYLFFPENISEMVRKPTKSQKMTVKKPSKLVIFCQKMQKRRLFGSKTTSYIKIDIIRKNVFPKVKLIKLNKFFYDSFGLIKGIQAVKTCHFCQKRLFGPK